MVVPGALEKKERCKAKTPENLERGQAVPERFAFGRCLWGWGVSVHKE